MDDLAGLRYLPLEKLPLRRPVNRVDYIRQRCEGKRVLDLGALDETEVSRNQHRTWKWLHEAIFQVAREVVGIDASAALKGKGEMKTSFGSVIKYGRVDDLGEVLSAYAPDLIVAGELIEHTPNPLEWLAAIGRQRPGVQILLTTPNATSIANIGLACLGREMMHKDHMQIYSFKTLVTLGRLLGLTGLSITPYYYHTELLRGRAPKFLLPAIVALDYALSAPLQFLFPLMSGGYILEGTYPS